MRNFRTLLATAAISALTAACGANADEPPSHLSTDDAFRQLGHQSSLRRGQGASADAAGRQVGLVQRDNRQHQKRREQNYRHHLDHLHFQRRAA